MPLGLEEGGGGGELADREIRHRLGLTGGSQRLVALQGVEVVRFVGADDQRRQTEPAATRAAATKPREKRGRTTVSRPGTAASDSQR